MRHASYMAVAFIVGGPAPFESQACSACEWLPLPIGDGSFFGRTYAERMVNGGSAVLPTCPHCAVLVDQALAIRAAHLQAIAEAA